MSYVTVEVDITDGRIVPKGGEQLPARARGLLTLLEPATETITCENLADWWATRERLPASEAAAFAQDLEDARRSLPPAGDAWG